MTNLGALASVFQLTAGVSLAVSVFRAPYESAYLRMKSTLDEEEKILSERDAGVAADQAQKVMDCRIALLLAKRRLDPQMRNFEVCVWFAVIYSASMLVLAAILPNQQLTVFFAFILMAISLLPLCLALLGIRNAVSVEFKAVRRDIDAL